MRCRAFPGLLLSSFSPAIQPGPWFTWMMLSAELLGLQIWLSQIFSHHINPFAVATRPTESKSKSISPSIWSQGIPNSMLVAASVHRPKQNRMESSQSEEKPALRKAPTHSNKLKAPTLQRRPLQIPTIAPLSVRPHDAKKNVKKQSKNVSHLAAQTASSQLSGRSGPVMLFFPEKRMRQS